jgi:3-isopropylmalate/(R)-2-methylmalate dehydratase small subunit
VNATGPVIVGRCWVFGDDIDTDVIIPSKYVALRDFTEMAKHALEPIEPNFGTHCRPGDIVVAGKSFGIGSSREAAALVFKVLGVGAIVAESYARIFFRNAINNGLYAIEAPGVRSIVNPGDNICIDLRGGRVFNPSTGAEVPIVPWPPMVLALVQAGGLVPFLKSQRGGTAAQL